MVRHTLVFVSVLALLCSPLSPLLAVEDQFNINLSVTAGADTIDPSVPTGLSATAVSSSQIDLTWSPSTDNVAVTGYRVYRDTVLITTTVATTYSDIGLSSGTLYSYTVSAIDAATNESAQSAPASATTFPASTPPGGGGSGGGGQSQTRIPQITNLVVVPSETSVVITYDTSLPAVGRVSWGLTSNYELGAVSETIFGTSHTVTISGLIAGTEYPFMISVTSGSGATNEIRNLLFKTLPLAQTNLNARNFTATPYENQILLNWRNPTDLNFREVRIVRSESFFPSDPNDGVVIYEGPSEKFEDSEVTVGVRYYYTLFAKDSLGNYSSGVIAEARIGVPGEQVGTPEGTLPNLPTAPNVHPAISGLQFLDFDFIQNGKKIIGSNSDQTISIDGDQNLTVSLDYSKAPEILKTIAVTLTHPNNPSKTFSFLLRVNEEKTLYTATIGALGDSGTYGVEIVIVDYKNQGLKNIFGSLLASTHDSAQGNQFFLSLLIMFENNFFYLLLAFVIALTLKVLSKQSKTSGSRISI